MNYFSQQWSSAVAMGWCLSHRPLPAEKWAVGDKLALDALETQKGCLGCSSIKNPWSRGRFKERSADRTHLVICCQCRKQGFFANQNEFCIYLFIRTDNNRTEPVVKLQASPNALVILTDRAKGAPKYSKDNPLTLIMADKCCQWVWEQGAAVFSLKWNGWSLRILEELRQWEFTTHWVTPQQFPGPSLFHPS